MQLVNHKGQTFKMDSQEYQNSLCTEGDTKYLSFQAMGIQMQKQFYDYCIKDIGYCEEDAFDFFFLMYFVVQKGKEYLFVTEGGLTKQGIKDIQNSENDFSKNPCCLSVVR